MFHHTRCRLRKVKMDQRKLMDNANTITDMAKTQNTVYEIVSDMSTRQDALEERITSLEDKIQLVQVNKRFANYSIRIPEGKNFAKTANILTLSTFSPKKDQLESLPEVLTRCLTQHQDRVDQRRNFLHPDTAALLGTASTGGLQTQPPTIGSPLFPHSR